MRPGLTFKLFILLASMGILASGMTGYYAYSTNRSLLVGEAQRNLLASTRLLGQRLSSTISDIAADAMTLAGAPAASSVARLAHGPSSAKDKQQLARLFAVMMRLHSDYSQIRLISRRQYGLELIRFDRNGASTVQVDGMQLQEKGHFPYVFETLALHAGQVYVSPITVNHELGAHSGVGRPTLRLATPVADPSGTVVGVVVINVDLMSMLKKLQVDLPADHQVYLTNQWGDFLVHPNPALTFGFDKGQRILIQDSFDQSKPLFQNSLRTVVFNGRDGVHPGTPQIMALMRMPFGLPEDRQFVVLGLSRPLESVISEARPLGRSIIQMVLAFSVLAIFLALLFARALTRPLQMLTNAATHFASSYHLAKLPLDRKDELGTLARVFEKMCREIQTHMEVLHSQKSELVRQAHHDLLTGLPNRMHFFLSLEQAIATASRIHGELAVLFIDLDGFKPVNDRFGHAAGDQVLVAVAGRLRHMLRTGDMAARLGGDEFVMLIKGDKMEKQIEGIAIRVLEVLNGQMKVEDYAVQVGASIGISLYPHDGSTAEELVQHADTAMYRAKSGGCNTFVRYTPPPADTQTSISERQDSPF